VFNGIAGGFGRAIRGENYKSWLVENCTINRTGGIYFLTPGSSASITVRKNRMRNVQGDGGSNKRQFLQLNGVSSATILAEWNEIINTFGQSYSEDVFSVFNTSNAVIRNNYVEGGYPATAGAGHQGTGILLADAGGSNNIAHDNQIVGVTNVGIGIAAGSNNTIRNNRVVSDGKTPTGVTLTGANLGIYAYMASGLPMSNNLIYDNLVGWMHSGSPMYRNDIWAPEADNNVAADNDYLYGNYSTPITAADEQAEWPIWLAKLAANSITVGA
jgi:parallel beta-helix repeat protein